MSTTLTEITKHIDAVIVQQWKLAEKNSTAKREYPQVYRAYSSAHSLILAVHARYEGYKKGSVGIDKVQTSLEQLKAALLDVNLRLSKKLRERLDKSINKLITQVNKVANQSASAGKKGSEKRSIPEVQSFVAGFNPQPKRKGPPTGTQTMSGGASIGAAGLWPSPSNNSGSSDLWVGDGDRKSPKDIGGVVLDREAERSRQQQKLKEEKLEEERQILQKRQDEMRRIADIKKQAEEREKAEAERKHRDAAEKELKRREADVQARKQMQRELEAKKQKYTNRSTQTGPMQAAPSSPQTVRITPISFVGKSHGLEPQYGAEQSWTIERLRTEYEKIVRVVRTYQNKVALEHAEREKQLKEKEAKDNSEREAGFQRKIDELRHKFTESSSSETKLKHDLEKHKQEFFKIVRNMRRERERYKREREKFDSERKKEQEGFQRERETWSQRFSEVTQRLHEQSHEWQGAHERDEGVLAGQRQHISEQQTEIDSLREFAQTSAATIERMRRDHTSEIGKLEDHYEKALEDMRRQQRLQELHKHSEENESFRKRFDRIEAQNRVLAKQFEDGKKLSEAQHRKIAELTLRNKKLEKSIAEQRVHNDSLEREYKGRLFSEEKMRRESERQLKALSDSVEKSSMQRKLQELDKQSSRDRARDEEKARHEAALSDMRAAYNERQQEFDVRIKELEAENESLRIADTRRDDALTRNEQTVRELKESLDESIKESMHLKQHLLALTTAQRSRGSAATHKFQNEISEIRLHLRAKEDANKGLKEELDRAHEELLREREARLKAEARVGDENDELRSLEEALDAARAELRDATARIDASERRVAEVEAENFEMVGAFNDLRTRNRELEPENIELRRGIKELEEQIEKLRAMLRDRELQLDAVGRQHAAAAEAAHRFERERDDLAIRLKGLDGDYKALADRERDLGGRFRHLEGQYAALGRHLRGVEAKAEADADAARADEDAAHKTILAMQTAAHNERVAADAARADLGVAQKELADARAAARRDAGVVARAIADADAARAALAIAQKNEVDARTAAGRDAGALAGAIADANAAHAALLLAQKNETDARTAAARDAGALAKVIADAKAKADQDAAALNAAQALVAKTTADAAAAVQAARDAALVDRNAKLLAEAAKAVAEKEREGYKAMVDTSHGKPPAGAPRR